MKNMWIFLLSILQLPAVLSESSFLKTSDVLKFMGRNNDDSDEKPRQDMRVIGAGFGRTGTASFLTALKRLGLKSYHMKDGIMETPGHLDLWHQHVKSGGNMVNEIIEKMAIDGFNATLDQPAAHLYQELMERYPQARVVLTVRRGGSDEWAESVLRSNAPVPQVFSNIPWKWIPNVVKMIDLLDWIGEESDAPNDPVTHLPDRVDMAQAYDNWNERVKSTVPQDRLLVFAPQDGWEPLCEFLSPLAPSIEEACVEVLESGDPYPHVNETASILRILAALRAITWLCRAAPFLAMTFVFMRRGGKKQKTA